MELQISSAEPPWIFAGITQENSCNEAASCLLAIPCLLSGFCRQNWTHCLHLAFGTFKFGFKVKI